MNFIALKSYWLLCLQPGLILNFSTVAQKVHICVMYGSLHTSLTD